MYADLKSKLETSLAQAQSITDQPKQQNFVTDQFTLIHKAYEDKLINHGEYLKLINRLAAYKNAAFNDYIDLLTGAAAAGMLEFFVAQSRKRNEAQAAAARRDMITKVFGIDPVEPNEGE